MNIQRKKLAIVALCAGLLGVAVGYYIGVESMIEITYQVAKRFIDVDRLMVRDALTTYSDQIMRCYNG